MASAESAARSSIDGGRRRVIDGPGKLLISLLGPFSLQHGSCVSGQLPKKAQALLAYLAMHRGRPLPREQLASLLWGYSGTEQARQSLRQCLVSLRTVLGDAVTADSSIVLFPVCDHIDIDVPRFEALSRSTKLEDLEVASELYRDDFLISLQIASEPFAEWMSFERQRLASMMADLLYRLAAARARAGNVQNAITAAQRLTVLDPLREDGHRLLMQLLASSGRRSTALKQHAACVEILRRDLGVAPEQATSELAEKIRAGASANAAAVPNAPETVAAPAGVPDAKAPAAAISGSRQPVFTLPDKPSIVVLPFSNLSDDHGQDYFADGMAEDITVALGHVPWLFVIASSSAFTYKSCNVDVRQVGAELGVRYVLRGSVRRDGQRVRIVVQLIDASHGGHIWADRFEGQMDNVFEIQDRVTSQVSATIAPALRSAEIERAQRKPTDNLTAYDLFLRALPRVRVNYAENQEALRLLQKAIELDPSYGAAYAHAAWCYAVQKTFGWVLPTDPRLEEGVRLARIAAEIGKAEPEVLWMVGYILNHLAGEFEHSLALIEKSISVNPNSAGAWWASGRVRSFLGDTTTALEHFARARRLNPLDTYHYNHWIGVLLAYFMAGRIEEAADAATAALRERAASPTALRMKIATCGLLGRVEEGREYLRRLLAVNPHATIASVRAFYEAPMQRNLPALETYLDGLRRCGLPEGNMDEGR